MALVEYYFPQQGYEYQTASGKLKFRFFYEDSTAQSINTNLHVLRISPIRIEFESKANEQTIRLPNFTLTLQGGDFFEGVNFTNGENKTFIEIYKDDQLYFTGYLDFDSIQKSDYYVDNGALKYRIIKFKIFDGLKYYYDNSITLSDIGYTGSESLQSLIQTMLSKFHNGNIAFTDQNIIIENCGLNYNLNDLKLADTQGNFLCRTLLSYVIKYLAINIFNINGIYYITARRGGSSLTIETSKIINLRKIANRSFIKYIEVKAQKDWSLQTNNTISLYTHIKNKGISNSRTINKLQIDATDFFKRIFVDYKGDSIDPYPSPAVSPDDYNTDYIYVIQQDGNDAYGHQIETGMVIALEGGVRSPIIDLYSDYEDPSDPSTLYSKYWFCNINYQGQVFSIDKTPEDDNSRKIYKIQKLVEHLFNQFDYLYFEKDNNLSFNVKGIDINITQKINILNYNRPIRRAIIDLQKNEMNITLF